MNHKKTIYIVQRSHLTNPVFLKLSKYVRDRKLTQALTLIEKHGIKGDLATFLIGTIQSIGEVKHELL